MASLSISDAARVAGVARSTLHRAIRAGRLSATPDGQIDTAELLRAGSTLQRSTRQAHAPTLQDAPPRSSDAQQVPVPVATQTMLLLRLERDLLRRELEAAQIQEQTAAAREHDAREERLALREREALLLQMLQEAHQRYDRLLEAPRPMPQVEPPPARTREPLTPISTPAPAVPDPAPGLVDETTRIPAYNPDTHYLGSLCKRGHDWHGTGYSLRHQRGARCLACDAEQARARRRQGGP
jgi:hypothetical protein